jgi:hypothetical protein
MTKILLTDFSGMAPKILRSKLAEPLAVAAINTKFSAGGITPWRRPEHTVTSVSFATELKSIYPYNGGWLVSGFPRQYVKSFIPGDIHNRIFYSDDAYPKVRSGSASYRLGLPRPAAPIPSVTTPGDMTNITDVRNQSYVVTFVDNFGTEGPSSVPTASVEVGAGGVVNVDLTPCVLAGNYNMGVGSYLRLYRSNTGSGGEALYQYMTDVAYGTAFYTDSMAPEFLQEELQSSEWVAAPDDSPLYPDGPLASMVEYPGGILAGHSGNTLYFSYPYVPTAWPYSYPLSDDIMGLAVIQGGLLVTTTGRPRLFTGSDPSTMAEVPIESYEANVSAQSVVDMGEYAIYASPRGLVMCQGNTAELATADILDEASWAAYQPTTIVAWRYEDHYVARYGSPDDQTFFIYTPGEGTASFVQFSGVNAPAGFFDSDSGRLYVAEPGVTETDYIISVFDHGAPLPLVWSKVFRMSDPVSLNCIRVVNDATGSINITLQSQYNAVGTAYDVFGPYTVNTNEPFKIPSLYAASQWYVTIHTIPGAEVRISYVELADSLLEMD